MIPNEVQIARSRLGAAKRNRRAALALLAEAERRVSELQTTLAYVIARDGTSA